MHSVFEIGIIGMGPAGIGMATSLYGTPEIRNTICFERGNDNVAINCPALMQNVCCYSDACSIISGIGGASTLSSGKISDFPAGSGLIDFFDSEQQLKQTLRESVSVFTNKIELKKIEIDTETKKSAELFYRQRNISYKYYDVYQFDGASYRNFIHETVQELRNEGLQLLDNSEVIDINRDPETSYFCIKVKILNDEKLFWVRNLVLATGALDIRAGLWKKVVSPLTNCFEIGLRVEAPNFVFGDTLSTHGDLKLKFDSGRTYCVTAKGKIISYKLLLSKNFTCELEGNGTVTIKNRNMYFEISENKLYKVVNIRYNPSQIASRLMTGDLYQCLMILETPDIAQYGTFLEYAKRITLEDELEAKIRTNKEFSRLSIGIHPILDVNKTERQLKVAINRICGTL